MGSGVVPISISYATGLVSSCVYQYQTDRRVDSAMSDLLSRRVLPYSLDKKLIEA